MTVFINTELGQCNIQWAWFELWKRFGSCEAKTETLDMTLT